MTTTAETTTTTRTCPPSDVADMIVPWPEVQPGEVVLWDGEFRRDLRRHWLVGTFAPASTHAMMIPL